MRIGGRGRVARIEAGGREEGGGDEGRGEAEQVEGDEEELVEGAADEEDGLGGTVSAAATRPREARCTLFV